MRFISVPCPQCEEPVDTVEGRETASCSACGALFRTGLDREELYLRGLDARMRAEEGRRVDGGAPGAEAGRGDDDPGVDPERTASHEAAHARGETLRTAELLALIGLLMALIGGGGGMILGRANAILDNLAALGLLAILIAGLLRFRDAGRR